MRKNQPGICPKCGKSHNQECCVFLCQECYQGFKKWKAGIYDSRSDILKHIDDVEMYINQILDQLVVRIDKHDQSKLESPEKEVFDEWTPKLSGITYGSDEYYVTLNRMKPAIAHHNKNNRHHAEYHVNGIEDMNLIDIVEMLCDWKAASLRHDDGDIQKSLDINADRFNMSNSIVKLLQNTIDSMGWK